MFPVNSLRIICSSRRVLLSHWVLTNRLSVPKTVTCSGHCMSSSCYKKEIWHSSMYFRGLFNYTKKDISFRSCFSSQVKLNCWKCKQLLEKTPAFFCNSCNIIQPPEEGTSYFKIMDCDYSFTLDTHKLQTRYLQLQRYLHPDNFSQKSEITKRFPLNVFNFVAHPLPKAYIKEHQLHNKNEKNKDDTGSGKKEQEFSESQSALVSKAYKTLLKPLSRGLYMLELRGMRLEEGTDSEADSDFLMELMDINEALDEAQTPEDANKIGQETKGKLADLTEQIDAALRKGELLAAKALLAKMKYHANIEEKVKEKLSGFM